MNEIFHTNHEAIDIKILPDSLVSESGAPLCHCMYFYVVAVGNDYNWALPSPVYHNVIGLGSIGIALRQPLSADVIDQTLLRGFCCNVLHVKLIYLGCKTVTPEEETTMENFHVAVMEWRSTFSLTEEEKYQTYSISPEKLAFLDLSSKVQLSSYPFSLLIFPSCQDVERVLTLFLGPHQGWMDYLHMEAKSAQLVMANLKLHQKLNLCTDRTKGSRYPINEEFVYKAANTDEISSMLASNLVSCGYGGILQVLPRGMENCMPKRLRDIRRFVICTDGGNVQHNGCEASVVDTERQTARKTKEDVATTAVTKTGRKRCRRELYYKSSYHSSNCIAAPKTLYPITFLEEFTRIHAPLRDHILRWSRDPDHVLLPAVRLSSTCKGYAAHFGLRQNSVTALDDCNCLSHWSTPSSSVLAGIHDGIEHIIPEMYRPLGDARYYHVAQMLPSFLWALQSVLLASELRQSLIALVRQTSALRLSNLCACTNEECTDFHFPTLAAVTTALTASSAGEQYDYERLESLGDSCLKYMLSLDTFLQHPLDNEEALTKRYFEQSSNDYFVKLSLRCGLAAYLRPWPRSTLEELRLRHLQGSSTLSFVNSLLGKSLTQPQKNPPKVTLLPIKYQYSEASLHQSLRRKPPSGALHASVLQYVSVEIDRKQLADSLEALVAAFFLSGGERLTLGCMQVLGFEQISLLPLLLRRESSHSSSKLTSTTAEEPKIVVGFALYEPLYERLHYRFLDPRLLEQALTHCSLFSMPHTTSSSAMMHSGSHETSHRFQFQQNNQRLEFVGDAILDFVCMLHWYRHYPQMRPRHFSSGKVFALNNRSLGHVGAFLGLHDYLRHRQVPMLVEEFDMLRKTLLPKSTATGTSSRGKTPGLTPSVGSCAFSSEHVHEYVVEHDVTRTSNTLFARRVVPSCSENQTKDNAYAATDQVEVKLNTASCKALADAVEALVAAIYLDAGGNLDSVYEAIKHWGILPPFMPKPFPLKSTKPTTKVG